MAATMHALRLVITLEDHLYHATQEVGRYFVTGRYLHNYGLSYALGLAASTYHDAVQVPRYEEQLGPLNEAGTYVTPGRPDGVHEVLHTFKLADTRYHVEMAPTSVNVPNFGRVRELAVGSRFVAYVLSRRPLRLPRWIRLGKWMTKASVQAESLPLREEKMAGPYRCGHPLNPVDLPAAPRLFDLIPMPPVSLVENAELVGPAYVVGPDRGGVRLPIGMGYGVAARAQAAGRAS
jgi:CRISPR-associated protein Csc1